MSQNRKVGCAGIIVADTICGPMPALPEEGQLLAVEAMPTKIGGCASNVAVDLARQGVEVEVLGCVGRDPAATVVRQCLADHGVGDHGLVATGQYPTSTTVILLVEGQDRRFIHTFGANAAFIADHLKHAWLESLSLFYLGGLFALPGLQPAGLLEVLKFCRSKGILTVVDVVVSQQFDQTDQIRELLPYTDYFLPNDDEAQRITGERNPRDQLRVLQSWGGRTIIITLGGEGCVAAYEGSYWKVGAFEMEVLDPSGCGDAFASGVIMAALHGWEITKTLCYASAVGAMTTQALGTTDGVRPRAEIEAFCASHPLEVSTC